MSSEGTVQLTYEDAVAARGLLQDECLAMGRKIAYYRDILTRIAGGWPTPVTLAQLALEHDFDPQDDDEVTTVDGEVTHGS